MTLSQLSKNSLRKLARSGLRRSFGSPGSRLLADRSAVSGPRCFVTPVGSKFEPCTKFCQASLKLPSRSLFQSILIEIPCDSPNEFQIEAGDQTMKFGSHDMFDASPGAQ